MSCIGACAIDASLFRLLHAVQRFVAAVALTLPRTTVAG
jgi:hypothetical protein